MTRAAAPGIRSVPLPPADLGAQPLPSSEAADHAPVVCLDHADLAAPPEGDPCTRLADLAARTAASTFLQEGGPLPPVTVAALLRSGDVPRLCLGLEAALTDAEPLAGVVPAAGSPVRLIRWSAARGDPDCLLAMLKRFARSGIWNHLSLSPATPPALTERLRRFSFDHPTIVHSWTFRADGSGFGLGFPEAPLPSTFGEVAPLPTRPLWHTVGDLAAWLLYLERFGARELVSWRARPDGRFLFRVGDHLTYRYLPPAALSADDLEQVARMIEAGGAPGRRWIRNNLARAFLIACAVEEGALVGNSSLKTPRTEYTAELGRRTGFDLSNSLERGYTAVRPEYRGLGIGTELLAGLTARAGDRKIYSVIAEDNPGAKEVATRNRTRKVASFFSRKLNRQVGLWMPEGMIPEAEARRARSSGDEG